MALGSLSAHARPKFVELLFFMGVVGLFAVGILQGAEAIDPIKARIEAAKVERFRYSIQMYVDQFGALPGDDRNAHTRWERRPARHSIAGASEPVNFTGDMIIQGGLSDPTQPFGEQYSAWQDLRFAGYIPGDPDLTGISSQPENLFGGLYGFSEFKLGMDQVICITNVPGKAARIIDDQVDDGHPASGSMLGSSRIRAETADMIEAPDKGAYFDGSTYILCMPFLPD